MLEIDFLIKLLRLGDGYGYEFSCNHYIFRAIKSTD